MSGELNQSGGALADRFLIEVVADSTISYAAQQNNVPLIRELRITNSSDEPAFDLEILVETDPPFGESAKFLFDRLSAGETRRVAPVDLAINRSYLSELTELERGRITVSLRSGGATETRIQHSVDVLAYDQWAGTRSLPELLAAFCMPNNPSVDGLVGRASLLLRDAAQGALMNGYQEKSREHVLRQVGAIYGAIAELNLQYANPPASFGTDGQKIRTPDRIAEARIATCLDLAMLFASCLEQAGLFPVILFQKNHAWVGCWLVENSLPTPTVEDAQMVRKRVASGELIVLESTMMAAQTKASLRAALELGQQHLKDEGDFRFAVDIKRARERRILPLPSRGGAVFAKGAHPTDTPPPIETLPPLPPLDPDVLTGTNLDSTPDTPAGRLSRWKSKLLDLSLRNRLLNFRPSKSNMQLLVPDPATLEDALADGGEFRFQAQPKLMEGADPRMSAVYLSRTGQQPLQEFARDSMRRSELIAIVDADKLDGRLLEIYTNAKLSLEEGGSNTLYLALGFLRWVEVERAETAHLAPLLLVPVTLQRKSVRAGFTLIRHDDDAIVNPTLLQLLREEFALNVRGLNPPPGDEHGVDVAKIWQIFRLAVMEIPKWEVLEHVYLGTFSFTKYLMWKDLQDRTAILRQNRVVAHLIDHPGEAIAIETNETSVRNLDDAYKPQDLLAPMLADSSQLQAICLAADGRDFVLEGPPGTGKSQTISNLIAHFLASGKTVLFASEKMAALEVVHRRLNTIGLGPFCLELHSAKARKSEVTQQLGQALNFAGAKAAADWDREADRLAALRQDLNAFARALHQRQSNGLTVYEAMGLAILHREWTPAVMPWSDAETHDRAALDELRESMRKIAALASQITTLQGHPLLPIARTDWSNAWEAELYSGANALDSAASNIEEAGQAVAKVLGLPEVGQSSRQYASMDALADVMLKVQRVPVGLAARATEPGVQIQIRVLREHGLRRNKLWSHIADQYEPSAASLNGAELKALSEQANVTWWPKRWFAKRALGSRFAVFRKDKRRPSPAEIEAVLSTLVALNEEDAALRSMKANAESLLLESYCGTETDWSQVERHEAWSKALTDAISRISADPNTMHVVRARVLPLVGEHRVLIAPTAPIGAKFLKFRETFREFVGKLDAIEVLASSNGVMSGNADEPAIISRVRSVLQRWATARRQIRSWCAWQDYRGRAISHGLTSVITALDSGTIAIDQVVDYFEFSYQTWWFQRIVDREPALRTFVSANHERKILEFRLADEQFQRLTRDYIVAKLAGRVPNANVQTGPDSEMGRLRRQLQMQRGLMPVRGLVQSLPTLLPKLKPCLLMSPLSVAQYLDSNHPPFDLVVFDEASQISVWDAVGVIARGKQLVVVGDPKQLPPTNFFSRTDDPEEMPAAEADVRDLESILDECLATGMTRLSLNWHYRSRHESLIAFSNIRYYDGQLITFPSPVTQDTAVSFRSVAGTYDRGGSRTNRAEADAIVEEIAGHFLDEKRRIKSLGVVTFNQPQMLLIQSLLDAKRRANPELDRLIADRKDEELLIKNLENVQGDERDVILFSITYGPDATGRVMMSFGPLNLEGGQRRLNVAISRARERVVIFSTLQPDHIDIARVSAAGVIDLKLYLDFAKRGPKALLEQSAPTGLDPDSPFEIAVIRALRERGWNVHPQVGCTGYRIDIGVVDPRALGRYLIGVECDGRSYHSGATARDRDRLRQLVLEGLGWKLHRIWSTDWWTDPRREVEKLNDILEAMVAIPVNEDVPVEVPSATFQVQSGPQQDTAPRETVGKAPLNAPVFVPGSVQPSGSQDAFYEMASGTKIQKQIVELIQAEGPLSEPTLFRKVARAWNLERTGSRIVARLRQLIPSSVRVSDSNDDRFYWPPNAIPETWAGFRISDGSESSKRHIDEIALQEIANVAIFLLEQGGSTSRGELARSVCRTVGMARIPVDAEIRADQGIALIIEQGRAAKDGERLRRL